LEPRRREPDNAVVIVVESRLIGRGGVMGSEMAVDDSARTVLVAFVHVLRGERGSSSHDGRTHNDRYRSNSPEHERHYGLAGSDGQRIQPFSILQLRQQVLQFISGSLPSDHPPDAP
jgi:hypothetical protein